MSGDRSSVLGVQIDRLGMDETVARCLELVEAGGPSSQVSVNAAKLVAAQSEPWIRQAFAEATLVSADGQAIVWASRLLGDPLPERVAGIDLMHRLLDAAAGRGYPVFVLGALREVLEDAVSRIRAAHPGLVVAGYRDGYFRDDEGEAVAEEIRTSGARIVFLAMSSPKKERWQSAHGTSLDALVMGVGGAVDVLAGRTRRAPRWMRRAGLEWLYRALQEPRRLGGRYARTNLRFSWLVLQAGLERIPGRPTRSRG